MTTDAALERLLLKEEVSELFAHEADLLDEHRYEEWLDLFTDDVAYSMPLRLNVAHDQQERSKTEAGRDVCWFDEGKTTLVQRVQQIRTGIHWAEEPVSRVSHLVTNVRVLSASSDEVTTGCRFVVYRNRVAAESDFFVGRRSDELRRTESGWRICRRELLLDQNVLLAKNLTVLF